MKNISIYLSNGKIDRVIICPDSMVEAQLKAGEQYIDGIYEESIYYVENGVAIEKTTPPNKYCYFDYASKTWVESYEIASNQVLAERNQLLASSDWTQMPDVNIVNKQEWLTYRQLLRDITKQSGYPFNVVWPTQPTE